MRSIDNFRQKSPAFEEIVGERKEQSSSDKQSRNVVRQTRVRVGNTLHHFISRIRGRVSMSNNIDNNPPNPTVSLSQRIVTHNTDSFTSEPRFSPIKQESLLTPKQFQNISQSLYKLESSQLASERYADIVTNIFSVGLPDSSEEDLNLAIASNRTQMTSPHNVKVDPLMELKASQGYTDLKKLFGINNIKEVQCAYHRNVTLTVEKNSHNHTLILTPNQDDSLTYHVLPENYMGKSIVEGTSKSFWTVDYDGNKASITLLKDNADKVNNKAFQEGLYKFEQEVNKAVKEHLPGAELIVMPKLIKDPLGNSLMTASTYGSSLFNIIQKAFYSKQENYDRKETFLTLIRDIYMANSALEKLGYHNNDTKLENSILLDTQEGYRAGVIDLDATITQGQEWVRTYGQMAQRFENLLYQAKVFSSRPEDLKYIIYKYYTSIVYLHELERALQCGHGRSYLYKSCLHINEKKVFKTKINQLPEQLFTFVHSPKAFLFELKNIYLQKVENNEEPEKNKQLAEHIKLLEYEYCTYVDNEHKTSTELDSIFRRLLFSEQLIKHRETIHNNIDRLLKKSNTENRGIDLTPHYLKNPDGTRNPSSLYKADELKKYYISNATIQFLLFRLLSREINIQTVVNNLRQASLIDKNRASDEDLAFFVSMFATPHKVMDVKADRKVNEEKIMKAVERMDKIIQGILQVEKYTKAEVQETVRKKIPTQIEFSTAL